MTVSQRLREAANDGVWFLTIPVTGGSDGVARAAAMARDSHWGIRAVWVDAGKTFMLLEYEAP